MGSDLAIPILVPPRERKTSFHYSFSFLPKLQRNALKTVYAFCRTSDDIVDSDHEVGKKVEILRQWREELERGLTGASSYQILNQLNTVARRFHIPVDHFYGLLRGVEMDLVKNRYETFEDLKEYCYLVASTVGLMSLSIFGPRNEETKHYAVNLGIALQLTNIIRDVGIDASYGRVYIPQEDLQRFHYSEAELFSSRYSPQFVALMEFEAARAEEYFKRAQEALPREDKRAMFAATIMERIYFHTLRRIREANYNVFGPPISLPRWAQLSIALKYWIKQRLLGR